MRSAFRVLGFLVGGILTALSIVVSVMSETEGPLLFVAFAAFMTRFFITRLPMSHPLLWMIQLPALAVMAALSFAHAYLLFDIVRGVDVFASPLISLLIVVFATSPVWLSAFVIYEVVVGGFFLFWRKKQQTVQ